MDEKLLIQQFEKIYKEKIHTNFIPFLNKENDDIKQKMKKLIKDLHSKKSNTFNLKTHFTRNNKSNLPKNNSNFNEFSFPHLPEINIKNNHTSFDRLTTQKNNSLISFKTPKTFYSPEASKNNIYVSFINNISYSTKKSKINEKLAFLRRINPTENFKSLIKSNSMDYAIKEKNKNENTKNYKFKNIVRKKIKFEDKFQLIFNKKIYKPNEHIEEKIRNIKKLQKDDNVAVSEYQKHLLEIARENISKKLFNLLKTDLKVISYKSNSNYKKINSNFKKRLREGMSKYNKDKKSKNFIWK